MNGRRKEKKNKKMMMNNRRFYNFPRITEALYLMYFESIIEYRSTLTAGRWSERLKTSMFESSELLLLLRIMGVLALSLLIDYMIQIYSAHSALISSWNSDTSVPK